MEAPRRQTSAPSRRRLLGFAEREAERPTTPLIARVAATCLSMVGTACRVCAEHCEPGAIRFRLALGGRSTPTIEAACNGCGACEPVCPVSSITLVPKPEATPCA